MAGQEAYRSGQTEQRAAEVIPPHYDNKRNWVLNTEVFFAIVLSTEPRIRIMPLVDMEASHEVKVWRWVCE